MRIRSITSFFDPGLPDAKTTLKLLAQLSASLRNEISDHHYPVLSTRIATVPFPGFMTGKTTAANLQLASDLDEETRLLGWDYLSLGPAQPGQTEGYALIPELLSRSERIFCSAILAQGGKLYPSAAAASAEIIHAASEISEDGFANLRFAALAHVPVDTPFLPAAYHRAATPPAISLAIECADVVVNAFSQSQTLAEGQEFLLSTFEKAARAMEETILRVLDHSVVVFQGFDFSPAPFPVDDCSLAGGVEKLGLEHIGGIGSLSAVAVLADTLDRGVWRRAGFNGMMLPVMEDSVLARRAEMGMLSVKDLLLYSTVCGTGLDTIPLPGDTTREELMAVLMDVGTLSARLGKPLTARLMPLPGKKVGDRVHFDFDYFADSRVMALDAQKISSPLRDEDSIRFTPRKPGEF